jgi:hypothetical protein
VKPSVVGTGVENVGANAARSAAPDTVPAPDRYPVLDVDTLTVDEIPAATPVTVNGSTLPLTVPVVTVPALPAVIDGVKVYTAS